MGRYNTIYWPLENIDIGIDAKNLKKLEKLGIKSIADMLYYFPRAYDDRTNIKKIGELKRGGVCSFKSYTYDCNSSPTRSGLKMVKATATDGSGIIELVWFQMPYLRKTLKIGEEYIFIGQVKRGYIFQIVNPEFKLSSNQKRLDEGEILPIYSSSKELPQNSLRKLMEKMLNTTLL